MAPTPPKLSTSRDAAAEKCTPLRTSLCRKLPNRRVAADTALSQCADDQVNHPVRLFVYGIQCVVAAAGGSRFSFTSRINDHFDMPQKLRMVEHMWRVAYADGHLSAHERHVLWRVADLLHVPQGAYVHARMRAEQAAGKT